MHAFKSVFSTNTGGSAVRMGIHLAAREAIHLHKVRYSVVPNAATGVALYLSVTGERVESPHAGLPGILEASDSRYIFIFDAANLTSVGFSRVPLDTEFTTGEFYGGDLVFGLHSLTNSDMTARVDLEFDIVVVSTERKMKLVQDTGRKVGRA